MKKFQLFILSYLFLFFYSTSCIAQTVTVTSGFAAWLQGNGYAGCLSGNVLDGSCPIVINTTKINCSSYNIQSLDGIELFIHLDTLIASGCQLNYINSLPYTLTRLDLSSNSITSINSFSYNLKYLNISNNDLTALPQLPSNLKQLDCHSNQLTSIPSLPSGLIELNASYNSLTDIGTLSDSIQIAYINNNQITSLPNLSNTLEYMYCDYNSLTTIPEIGNNMIKFYCSNNVINSLPVLSNASSLIEFNCASNLLTSLSALPNSLIKLYCNDNQLISLPSLPMSLQRLECSQNDITALPNLANLKYLYCSQNPLYSGLPTLPNTLLELDCQEDSLSTLPTLPINIQNLNCSNNNLTSLPQLPVSLYVLNCSFNQITNLPSIPTLLFKLNCSHNELTNLPNLPSELSQILINDNPNIMCLPAIEKFNGNSYNFSITNTGIHCLPNYIQHYYSLPSIDTLPLCGIFSNPAGCEIAWNIAGRIYIDENSNCLFDSVEFNINQIKMQLALGSTVVQQVYSNTAGFYSFNSDLNEYEIKIDTTGLPFNVVCPNSNSYVTNLFGIDTLDFNGNFALECKPGYDLTTRYISHTSGMFFPTNTATVVFSAGDLAQYYGVNCNTIGVAGTIKAWFSGPQSFTYIPSGWTQNNDTLTLSLNDISQLNLEQGFTLSFLTDTFPPAGSQFCLTVEIQANGIDNNPFNDTTMHCFDVINSFDPNYKEVYPSYSELPGEWHTYTIHFQNTGTAAAQNILLKDTLDVNLNWASFEKLASSHSVFTQVLENGIVHFNFPQINLPDSTSNEPESHGWVQYRIKTNQNLTTATTIHNKAAIYFDFNSPVITNDAQIKFCTPSQQNNTILFCQGDSVLIGNSWHKEEGVYSYQYSSISGCDSTINTILQFRSTSGNIVNIALCQGESITYDGIVYDTDGNYERNYTSAFGCDSLVTISIHTNTDTSSTENFIFCEGDNIYVHGHYYFNPTSFITNFTSSSGCDSVVTTIIEELPVEFTVINNDPTLSVVQNMQFYQWIDCITNEPVMGASMQVFTPEINGIYKVLVLTENGCIKTSDCFAIGFVGINPINDIHFKLYPNPAFDQLTLIHPEMDGTIYLCDLTGRIISELTLSKTNSTLINTTNLSSGNYLLKVKSTSIESKTLRFSVIK